MRIIPDKSGISLREMAFGDITQVEMHDAIVVIGKNSRNEIVYIDIVFLEKNDDH